jgi:hypothetical protein
VRDLLQTVLVLVVSIVLNAVVHGIEDDGPADHSVLLHVKPSKIKMQPSVFILKILPWGMADRVSTSLSSSIKNFTSPTRKYAVTSTSTPPSDTPALESFSRSKESKVASSGPLTVRSPVAKKD